MAYTDKEMLKEIVIAAIKVVPFVTVTVCIYLFKKIKVLAFRDVSVEAAKHGYEVNM